MTLFERFIKNVKKRPQHEAVIYFSNKQKYSLNWQQVYDYCEIYAQGLQELGVEKGQSVAIYSNTCKEWGFLDMAIMGLGAKTVPIYQSSHLEDVDFILKHSQAKVIVVESLDLLNKLKKTSTFSKIKTIILMRGSAPEAISLKDMTSEKKNFSLAEEVEKIKLEDEATVIYTSGTSGTPKGVLLTHQQVMSCVSDSFPLLGVTHKDRTLTFLPFSHVLGRVELWGSYFTGYTLGYAQSIEQLKYNLPIIKPTVIVGVPRIFEKIYYGIRAQIDISKLKEQAFMQAVKVGKKIAQYRKERKSPPLYLALQYKVAQSTVLKKILEKLGGKLRFAISGGAPLDPEIAHFFDACGLTILEGYGLTETTGPIFVNTLFEYKLGTVGKAIGDTQIRLEEDGEILLKSAKVMKEYYKNPTATAEVFTEDGYFRTGDIGELDSENYLRITDRKKDLIKTAGGKFVAPQKLQNLFAISPLIEHIHIHGDKKKYIVALITLEKGALHQLKKKHQLTEKSTEKLINNPHIEKEVRRTVAEVNQRLASFETIKRFKVLDHEFSVEGGQLTPSLKIKRKKIDQMYENQINSLYN